MFSRGSPELSPSGRVGDLTELLRACLVAPRAPEEQAAAFRPRPSPLWRASDALPHMRQLVCVLPDGSPLPAFLPQLGAEEPDSVLRARAALSSTLIAGLELPRDGVLALDQDAAWTPVRVRRRTNAEPETARRELPLGKLPARVDVQQKLQRGRGPGPCRTSPAHHGRRRGRRELRDQQGQDEPVRPASVGPEKDIAQRIAQPVGDPALRQMVVPVVDHVAALAEAPQIAQPVVLRVVVEMRGGQDHPRRAHLDRLDERGPAGRPATAVAPGLTQRIEPSSIGEAADRGAVRPLAALALAAGALEADASADLRPMRRIEPAQFGSDRHRPGF